jgi:hypothetical protein
MFVVGRSSNQKSRGFRDGWIARHRPLIGPINVLAKPPSRRSCSPAGSPRALSTFSRVPRFLGSPHHLVLTYLRLQPSRPLSRFSVVLGVPSLGLYRGRRAKPLKTSWPGNGTSHLTSLRADWGPISDPLHAAQG